MSLAPLKDLSRLCVHTITTKPWDIETAVERYAKAGVKGITVWRDALAGRSIHTTGNLIRQHGLEIVSLCRGGFFPHTTAAGRQQAINDNLRN
jgi:sugar phosphate isomerase/epimerase